MIQKLSPLVIAQIAAGEVIEDPAGALKELLDNCVDANAERIEVYLENWGTDLVQVRDDGDGISKADLKICLENFSTSKLNDTADLAKIQSMGFRGEALASIRSIAQFTVQSKPVDQDIAYEIRAAGDEIAEIRPCALNNGTRITAENFFFNLPVRKKFLPPPNALRKKILKVMRQFSYVNWNVHVKLTNDKSEVFSYPAASSLLARLSMVQPGVEGTLLPIFHEENSITLKGYISSFQIHRSNPTDIYFFVNKRPVQYSKLSTLLRRVYGELLPAGKFPVAYLFLEIPPNLIDVNIHPQKKEILFLEEHLILEVIEKAVKSQMGSNRPIPFESMIHQDKHKDFGIQHDSIQEPLVFADKSTVENVAPGNHHFRVAKVHCRLFNTFLLASNEDNFFLIDQHTAHERINYEKILNAIDSSNDNLSQALLIPINLQLNEEDSRLLEENGSLCVGIGFQFNFLGPAGVRVESVPFYISEGHETEAVEKLIKLLEKNTGVENWNHRDLFDQLAKDLSCRASITKGESTSMENMEMLLQQLAECNEPSRCPHGRPTMIEFNREDVFSMFKRRDD